MSESWGIKLGLLIGIAAGLFVAATGAAVIAGSGLFGSVQLARAAWGGGVLLAGIAIVVGLVVAASRPRVGLSLIAGGVLVTSALAYWVSMFTIPIGAALMAFAYFRGRRDTRPRGTGAA